MKCNCAECGKEIESTWAVKHNFGRHQEYICDKCATRSRYEVRLYRSDNKKKLMKGREK